MKSKSLAEINPSLATEWHPTRNGAAAPDDVAANSHKRVWWLCPKGHEWEAQVKSRNNGVGCPFCSGRNVRGDNCLLKVNPDLSKEWHPTKNGELTPGHVTPSSAKKVWWMCAKGHEWVASIDNRNRGSGCPRCVNRHYGRARATEKYCLLALNPPLSKEWHPTKNGYLSPKDVTPGSTKKVWWLCAKQHEWEARVGSRVKGSGCPYCTGQRVTESNSLQFVNPGLATEWHPTRNGELTPRGITANCHRKAWWLCREGHVWEAIVSNRNLLGQGCPYCSGQRAYENNNLQSVNPELAKQWHPTRNGELTPTDITASTNKNVWWICPNNHEWKASPSNRNRAGQGCPYCSGKKASRTHNLELVNPDLCREWHPTRNGELTPGHVTPHSSKKVWWICRRGHEWVASIDKRVNGRGCPFCHSQTSQLELRIYSEMKHMFKDTKHREQLYGFECDVYLPSVKVAIEIDSLFYHKDKYLSEQEKTEKLSMQGILLIRLRERGLKTISDRDVVFTQNKIGFDLLKRVVEQILTSQNLSAEDKFNLERYVEEGKIANEQEYIKLLHMLPSPLPGYSLKDLNESLEVEWHPYRNGTLSPSDVTPNSNKIVWWKCHKNHEWRATIFSRNRGIGCPYCSGKRATNESCLSTVNPALAKQWHPTKNGDLTASAVTVKSGKFVWWVCSKGHEWRARIAHRSNGTNCPYCASNLVCDDNCLQTINPTLAKQWHPTRNDALTPRDVMPNANRDIWWQCREGHEWRAQIGSRNRGDGCPYCSGRKVTYEKSLGVLNPILAKEWHPTKNGVLNPFGISPRTSRNVWWVCSKGHEWRATIYQRSTQATACPYCYGRKAHAENSLQTKNPDLCREWNPTKNGSLTPNDVTANSGKKVWWLCSAGHEWQAEIYRRNKGSGCPKCYRNAPRISRANDANCLSTINPRVAKEWHPTRNSSLTPKNVSANSHKKAWWLCDKGHEWYAQIKSRNRGANCPYCRKKGKLLK